MACLRYVVENISSPRLNRKVRIFSKLVLESKVSRSSSAGREKELHLV
jgi:hypothetical protein